MPKREQPSLMIAVTAMQAAEACNLNPRHIYEARKNRELVAHRVGSKNLILVRDIIAWIESKPEVPATRPRNTKENAT